MIIVRVIFFLLLLDSVAANLIVYFGPRWYTRHFRLISRFVPPAKGWALYYFVLVLWIGWLSFT